MTRHIILPALILAVWATASAAREPDPIDSMDPAEVAAARAAVESLQGVLIECMKEAETLGFEGRSERIKAQLSESFDMAFVARNGLGRNWKELSPEQQSRFSDLNEKLTAARYAANFDGYGGQRFETRAVKPAARRTLIVKTEFVQPEDRDVRFDYRLRKTPVGWRIFDVVIDGAISEFVVWRDQFRSVIENQSFPGLIEAMEKKIEQLSHE
jgi:phospholipid transport system substrate-binding protein